MQRKVVVLLLLTTALFTNAKSIVPVVDQRMELMSLVFRLAEAEEYSVNKSSPYIERAYKEFASLREHELIMYTKLLRANYGVAFDAVPRLALSLQIKKGEVAFRPDIDITKIDKRWQPDSLPKYIKLLNKFYKESEFASFFQANADFYAKVEDNFNKKVMNNINLKWFDDFFGVKKIENFQVIVELMSGGGNYGPQIKTTKGKEEYYGIFCSWQTDSIGVPIYMSGMSGLVAHELSHSYWEPIIATYYKDIMPQSNKMFKLVAHYMREMHYGNAKSCFNEMLTNASAILYDNDNPISGNFGEDWRLCMETNNGFIAIKPILYAMKKYQNQREQYTTMNDFMPEIVKVFNDLDIEKIYTEFESQRPVILGTNIENGNQSVDYMLDSIIVSFDKPMNIYSNGLSQNIKCVSCKKLKSKHNAYWSEDKKNWIIKVELEPDTEYSINFPSGFFFVEGKCRRPKNTYTLTFKTRKKQ